ncbi:MAG: helix-turn-helix domain-containing protein [Gordonia sp. (in: high G+C Gram-positive bacteria)]|nr:helix-turn-helix domain-containing protein [Gordonia sp. (in: high G+C Gram-positive bacteria)]
MIDVDTLAESLGEGIVRRTGKGVRRTVTDVLLADGDLPSHDAGTLLLGNGAHDVDSALEVLQAAGAVQAAAVVLRAPYAESPEVAAVAADLGLSVLELRPIVSWTHFVWLVRSVLDQSTSSAGALVAHPVDYSELFEFADAAAAIVSAPVTIEDAFSRVLAYSALQDTADPVRISTIVGRRVPEHVVKHFRSRGVFRTLHAATEPFRVAASSDGVLERLVVPVRAGRELLGSIWVVDPGPLSDEQLAELVRTTSVVALHLLRLRAVFGAARRATIERLRSVLITGDESSDRLPDGPWRVVALGNTSVDEGFGLELWEITLRRSGWSQPLLTEVDGIPMALVTATGRRAGSWAWLSATAQAPSRTGTHLAAGRVADVAADLPRSRADAIDVLALQRAGTVPTPATSDDAWHEVVITRAVASLAGTAPSPVDVLARHDAEHSTAHVQTLREILASPAEPTRAAARLGIHPNTLRNRRNAIVALIGVDLDDARVRLALSLLCAR